MPELTAEFITADEANAKIALAAAGEGFVHCHRADREPITDHTFTPTEAATLLAHPATLNGVVQIAYVDRQDKTRCLHVFTPDNELYVFPDIVP